MGTDWSRKFLDLLFAHIFEDKVELIADLIANHLADTDPARLGQCLETCRDIDPVPVYVPFIDYDVANVDANTKPNTTFGRHAHIALVHLPLHVDCAAHRVDYAGKFYEQSVTSGFDDPATVLFDLGPRKFSPVKLAFDLLFDAGNMVAESYGLTLRLLDDLIKVYVTRGIDLPTLNGDSNWRLPIPARMVLAKGGAATLDRCGSGLHAPVKPG
jgi:hypothetical protein